MGAKKNNNALPPTNRSQKFWNSTIVLDFPANGPHKTPFGIFEIVSFQFLTFFFRKFQIYHCTLMEISKNLKYLENERA